MVGGDIAVNPLQPLSCVQSGYRQEGWGSCLARWRDINRYLFAGNHFAKI